LINDILDFSKIEAGQLRLEEVEMDLRETVEDVAEVLAPKAAEKGIELAVRFVPGTPRYVVGDPVRIRQIITNLVGNAVKFTEDGHVVIQVEEEPSANGGAPNVRMSVEDTGIGIEADSLARVFDKFEQADASTTRKFGGTGLGLSICRELAQMMGGDIQASSMPGRGSTFWVSVPLSPAMVDPKSSMGLTAPGEASLLVLSPSPVVRQVLKEQLGDLGATVTAGMDTGQGLLALKKAIGAGMPYTMVVLDDAFGMEVLGAFVEEIRSQANGSSPYFVRLTNGHPRPGDPGWADFDLHVTKPILERRIQEVLRILEDGGADAGGMAFARARTRSAASGSAQATLNGRILLVEDDEINRKVASNMLSRMGLEYEIAVNGREALKALEAGAFDLVLMDCQMPDMDGFEATGRIRAEEAGGTDRLPIIALTAAALQGDRERCLAAGMDDYLTKPLVIDQLREALGHWLTPEEASAKTAGNGSAKNLGSTADSAEAEGPTIGSAGPEPSPPDPSVFDTASAVERVGGSFELLIQICGMFMEGWEDSRSEFKAALEAQDAEEIRRVAHRVKGTAGNLSAIKVAERAARLEKLGSSGQVDEAVQEFRRLEEAVVAFRQAVSSVSSGEFSHH
jgi:CheY-like chemotaxis protein/HPt (histidine-containing phosphotransfer) domain-containing protein